jgi:hypothetical protein
MTPPTRDHPALRGAPAQITQVVRIHDSKTDQTAQSDQRIETAREFGTLLGPELTSRHPKLTSGTVQRSNPALQVLGIPVNTAQGRPSHGAPSP